MTTPTAIPIPSFFYPVGNTPATCLTQDIPPGRAAKVLLLGCGDARNVLYTVYSNTRPNVESGDGDDNLERELDFTCCDVEVAVLARNILLFSLILDEDDDGTLRQTIWNIYYELFLDETSLGIFEKYARKLYGLSSSMEQWHSRPYGQILRICDSITLCQIRDVWASYLPGGGENHEPDQTQRSKHRFVVQDRLKKAVAFRNSKAPGPNLSLATILRSAAPLVGAAMEDAFKIAHHFWDREHTNLQPNPGLILAATDTPNLHYGSDSLLGFHLSTSYAPLLADPEHIPTSKSGNAIQRLKDTAQLQFSKWTESFRKSRKGLTVRFCAADALAFCYTYQHLNLTDKVGASWPRHAFQAANLTLNGPDFHQQSSPKAAPRFFNAIDTSNLGDHLGPLNVLAAAAPLLDQHDMSSTLYTESLVKRNKDFQSSLDEFLHGHFPTMTVVLGLFPVGYWTNASVVSDADENLLSSKDGEQFATQSFHRQSWKPSTTGTQSNNVKVEFHETDLGSTLARCYIMLFDHEVAGCEPNEAKNSSHCYKNAAALPRYHRANFAAFLKYVKGRVRVTNWEKMIEELVQQVERQYRNTLGANYLQEFYMYLHLYGVFSAETFQSSFFKNKRSRRHDDLRAWKKLPPVVSVTLRIPRAKLHVFTKPGAKTLTPIVDGVVTSSRGTWQNRFGSVQLCFGSIRVSGTRSKDDYAVTISQDPNGWNGTSDLYVSFWAPTWTLLEEPGTTLIGFGLQTAQRAVSYVEELGIGMKVHIARMGSRPDVFITKKRPNGGKYPVLGATPESAEGRNDNSENLSTEQDTSSVCVKSVFGPLGPPEIKGFAAQINLSTDDAKTYFAAEKECCELEQLSPCCVSARIKNTSLRYDIYFPIPVIASLNEIILSASAPHIEFIVPVFDRPDIRFPGYMFPVLLDNGRPIAWNSPFIKMDRLPIIDRQNTSKLQWLNLHASLMFSPRERKLRADSLSSDARVNLKESLLSMYMYFTGLQVERPVSAFTLNQPRSSGTDTLIFISAARLNSSNRTVVLDAAVLCLTKELVGKLDPFLNGLSGKIIQITVDEQENILWKQILPAFAERCRTWEHRASCEYTRASCIPLSTASNEPVLCSCGKGILPSNDFSPDVPNWDLAAPHVVRIAISPVFPVPLVEKPFSVDDCTPEERAATSTAVHKKGDSECWNCRKSQNPTGEFNLRQCSKCHEAKYCSRSCQRSHWKTHKAICNKG